MTNLERIIATLGAGTEAADIQYMMGQIARDDVQVKATQEQDKENQASMRRVAADSEKAGASAPG